MEAKDSPNRSVILRQRRKIVAVAGLALVALAAITPFGARAAFGDAQIANGSQPQPVDAQAAPAVPTAVHVEQQGTTTPANTSSNSQSTVTVNGQSVAVPANGSVHQTIDNNGSGQTEVKVQSQSSNSSVNLHVSTDSYSSSDSEPDE